MNRRRTARELILRLLYQIEVGKLPLEEVLSTVAAEIRPPAEDWDYAQEVVRGVTAEIPALDQIIGDLAEGWRLERLAKVDKNILRMALYELRHYPELPVSLIVNDAVEVAKKYSLEESGRFVNGILGSYLRRGLSEGSPPDAVETGARG